MLSASQKSSSDTTGLVAPEVPTVVKLPGVLDRVCASLAGAVSEVEDDCAGAGGDSKSSRRSNTLCPEGAVCWDVTEDFTRAGSGGGEDRKSQGSGSDVATGIEVVDFEDVAPSESSLSHKAVVCEPTAGLVCCWC